MERNYYKLCDTIGRSHIRRLSHNMRESAIPISLYQNPIQYYRYMCNDDSLTIAVRTLPANSLLILGILCGSMCCMIIISVFFSFISSVRSLFYTSDGSSNLNVHKLELSMYHVVFVLVCQGVQTLPQSKRSTRPLFARSPCILTAVCITLYRNTHGLVCCVPVGNVCARTAYRW